MPDKKISFAQKLIAADVGSSRTESDRDQLFNDLLNREKAFESHVGKVALVSWAMTLGCIVLFSVAAVISRNGGRSRRRCRNDVYDIFCCRRCDQPGYRTIDHFVLAFSIKNIISCDDRKTVSRFGRAIEEVRSLTLGTNNTEAYWRARLKALLGMQLIGCIYCP